LVDWTVTIDGSDGKHTYTNWVALQGDAVTEGTSGNWELFEENSSDKIGDFTWNITNNNRKEGIFTQVDSTIIFEVINLPDRSGSLVKRENSIITYEAVWDQTGVGSWITRDLQGNVTATGVWS